MQTMRFPLPIIVLLLASLSPHASAQTPPAARMPPDYRGPEMRVQGIFVTPVPGAPFSATVDIVSTQVLPNGATVTRTTLNHIARDSAGRIYNERRRMVPITFKGDPPLTSGHIYDPSTRVSIYTDPYTRLARQTILPPPRDPSANPNQPRVTPNTTESDLGNQLVSGVEMKGIRKTRVVPAAVSETGKDVVITDEYWYSPELSIYMLIKHDDARTGTQLVAITNVDRHEPDATHFTVPPNYKLVDETPLPRETAVQ